MAESTDLVEYCLYLLQIILDGADHAVRVVESADVGNFRSVEVVHATTRRSVHQVVSGMLVCPGCMAAFGFHDFKNGIGAERAMRIQRHTIAESVPDARQLGWIDDVLRNILLVIE